MNALKKVFAVVALAALPFAAACKPPKYIKYNSESGDFTAQVPWGWSVYLDRQGDDFYGYTFVGPFDPDFHRGVPTLQARWYGKNRVRTLPDGSVETYPSPQDFVERTLRDLYGPEKALKVEPHPIAVSGWEATHFVVISPMEVPGTMRFGVSEEAESKKTVVLRQHAYVVVPMDTGFYVLIYPATRGGFEKYEDRFNNLVNTFRALKDGPGGPLLKP